MKTSLVFILMTFLFSGCIMKESENGKDSGLIPSEASLKLMTPQGMMIAPDINALKEKLDIVGKIVTRIEFANPEEFGIVGDNAGYLALVYYIDENCRETNMAIAEGDFADLLTKCKNK